MELKAAFLWLCFILTILFADVLSAKSENSQKTQNSASVVPENSVIEKWRGTWDVKAIRRQPLPAQDVTWEETSVWVLNGRYLRTETSQKSDGGKIMSMFWYDMFSKTYLYVTYDQSGIALLYPPLAWNESTQTMEWKSSWFSPISTTGYATFTDKDTIKWKVLWKDWKGTVTMDIEGTSIRRK